MLIAGLALMAALRWHFGARDAEIEGSSGGNSCRCNMIPAFLRAAISDRSPSTPLRPSASKRYYPSHSKGFISMEVDSTVTSRTPIQSSRFQRWNPLRVRSPLLSLARKFRTSETALGLIRHVFRTFQSVGISLLSSQNHYYWPVPDFKGIRGLESGRQNKHRLESISFWKNSCIFCKMSYPATQQNGHRSREPFQGRDISAVMDFLRRSMPKLRIAWFATSNPSGLSKWAAGTAAGSWQPRWNRI